MAIYGEDSVLSLSMNESEFGTKTLNSYIRTNFLLFRSLQQLVST